MINQPTIVCDIDGTLANCEHRVHWVRSNPKNWTAFNAAMEFDTPELDIIWMVKTFHAAGCKILIASGRSDDYRSQTKHWLDNVATLYNVYEKLYMRRYGDTRPDDVVKGELLDQMILDGYNPTISIDDRNSVVALWRSRGLRCLQVRYGDY